MSPGAPAAVMDAPSPVEARFADLCKSTELGLDESMAQQAMILFKDTHILSSNIRAIGAGSPEEMERLWSAFVLYCVARLSPPRDREDATLLLPRILKASKLKFVDFIKETPQFSLKAGFILTAFYGSDWEKKLELKEHQASIEQLSLLKRHYRRSYHEFFLPSETSSSQQSGVSDRAEFTSDYHRFGWLLFMALRVHDFGPFKDLVTCTNGLVSIMAILILHVPIRLRSFSIQESSPFAKKSDKGINLLASLSDICHTSEDELRITMGKVNKLIIDVLMKKPCPASECNRETLECIDPDGLTYFEDLLEDNSLISCLSILEKDYDDAISTKGDLDEHIFANGDNRLLGTGTINISGTKRKLDVFSSPTNTRISPLSPPCSPTPSRNGILVGNCRVPAATPVTTAMTTAKWLRTVISPLPSTPSTELERFLSSCDKDVTGDVTRRASIILEAIFPSSSFGEKGISVCESMSQTDNTWAERRRMEALKLYYRILEAICRAESSIPPGNNLSLLLSSERFHRCMLACSAELVLATYKTITMAFPAVLEKTGITAFDLSKMIECFVRHEETLPRELKRHLNFLEERLLESMVWEKGSSMYNSLIVARAALSDEINRLELLAEPLPSLDLIAMQHNIRIGGLPPLPFHKSDTSQDQNGDARSPKRICGEYKTDLLERTSFMSPIKERLLTNSLKSMMPPLQSAFASPNRRNPAGDDTCGAAGINGFFSKILKLVAIRIRSLCDRLQLSQPIQERIYFLVQKILSHQTALFFNRHIDQIILCSFYGVAKISQLSLTFKDIIYNYRKQPQCKLQVFRSVFVNWPPTSRGGKTGEEHVDIITFYNEIFIPCAKPLLVELGPSGITDSRDQEDKQSANGSVPVSPRFSPFPNLPDMSPKKVSAARNVYVSPLRSSKMDSMLSPSSKSFYACIGESTHAFQSPSKDLSAINNRLNCSGRKISGRLNFDMVSDSVVAGSFVPSQSGSLVSSTANLNNPPTKCEEPES